MKRLFSLLLLLVVFSIGLEAQTKFGVRSAIGVITARPEITFVGNQSDFITHEVKYEDSKVVLSYGIFAQSKIGWLFVQPEILYSSYKVGYDVRNFLEEGFPVTRLDESYKFLDFQMIGGVHTNNFRLGVGPIAHILLKQETELIAVPTFIEKERELTFGFTGLIGYDWGRFAFDLKLETAFRSVGEHIYYGDRKSKFKGSPDQLSLAIGISF